MLYWCRAFIRSHGIGHQATMGGPDVEALLPWLSKERQVLFHLSVSLVDLAVSVWQGVEDKTTSDEIQKLQGKADVVSTTISPRSQVGRRRVGKPMDALRAQSTGGGSSQADVPRPFSGHILPPA